MDPTEENLEHNSDDITKINYTEDGCQEITLKKDPQEFAIQENYQEETSKLIKNTYNINQEETEFNKCINYKEVFQAEEKELNEDVYKSALNESMEDIDKNNEVDETELDKSIEDLEQSDKSEDTYLNEITEDIEEKDLLRVLREILDKLNKSLAKSSVTKSKPYVHTSGDGGVLNQREETISIELDKSIVQDFLRGLTMLERICGSGSFANIKKPLCNKKGSNIKTVGKDENMIKSQKVKKSSKESEKEHIIKKENETNRNDLKVSEENNQYAAEVKTEQLDAEIKIEDWGVQKEQPIRTTRSGQKFATDLHDTNRKSVRKTAIERRGYRRHPVGWEVILTGPNGGPPFKCPFCMYENNVSKSATKRHMIMHMPDELCVWYNCDQCDYKSKRQNCLKAHQLTHKADTDIEWNRCAKCPAKFKQKSGLKMHLIRHKNRDECERYNCDSCDYSTPFQYAIKRHILTHKTLDQVDKYYTCHVCSYTTPNRFYIKRHSKLHGEPTYKCNLCAYSAHWKANLDNHMIGHNREEFIRNCDLCDFTTVRNYSMKKHMRRKHQSGTENGEGVEILYCHNCDYSTKLKRCLVSHMVMHA